ncbi:MAG TPA: hypothetical protein PLF11_11435, partial [Bacillota bacterium]|nr:hypothetical protein [Bacillota bacterium]
QMPRRLTVCHRRPSSMSPDIAISDSTKPAAFLYMRLGHALRVFSRDQSPWFSIDGCTQAD